MAANQVNKLSDAMVVFLCGARDYHAMDWYRSALNLLPEKRVVILTDLISGEGFKKLINESDSLHRLFILDKLLFARQSALGNYWRNLLKLLVFPLQLMLLKRFSRKHPNAIYHAHSMYYLWLACAARVPYIGTPQGSDILVKPYKSKLYFTASKLSLRKAKAITVDSLKMASAVEEIAGVRAIVIQNGVDISSIAQEKSSVSDDACSRNIVVSMRAITPLYRIKEIVEARNRSDSEFRHILHLIYPFYESEYLSGVSDILYADDKNLGRVTREQMYHIFFRSLLVISIPSSDSSPRSVYEAIFCGAVVAVTYHPYIDTLPECMRRRIILVNLQEEDWFSEAIREAKVIAKVPFYPSDEALKTFDQLQSFQIIRSLLVN